MSGAMRAVGRLAAVAAVALVLAGLGAGAAEASPLKVDDYGSPGRFERACVERLGGSFAVAEDGTLWCRYPDGGRTFCDALGLNCWYIPPAPEPTGPRAPSPGEAMAGEGSGGAAAAPANATPTAAVDAYWVAEDRVLRRGAAGGVLANDADPDGDALTARLVEGPSKGTLTLEDDGSFVYKPKRNFHGTVSFTYEVEDGTGGTATATATIKVLARPN